MEKLNFKLEGFEGPLDLLLHLIAKHKLNIYDIEISNLVQQYLKYIKLMQQENLEVASDFLEMAARLVYLKSVSLLPKHKVSENLKQELEGQLIEYSICKYAAQKLVEIGKEIERFVRVPETFEVDKKYTRFHDPDELIKHFFSLNQKHKYKMPPDMANFSGIVATKIVSVDSRISFILKKLYKNSIIDHYNIYETDNRSENVATFLAVLELIKLKRITLSDDKKIYFNK